MTTGGRGVCIEVLRARDALRCALIAEIDAALATIVELAARPSYVTMAEAASDKRGALLDYCGGTVGTLPRCETGTDMGWCACGEGYAYRGNVLLGSGVIVHGTDR